MAVAGSSAAKAGTALPAGALRQPGYGLLRTPSRHNRGSALLVVAVNLHVLPHVVDVIGIAPHEPVDRGAVIGIDDEDAAAGRLAVVRDEGTGGDDVHVVICGLVEMMRWSR